MKENQGRLYQDVRDLFEGAEEYDFEGVSYDFARTLNKGHGRLETRQCWVITDPDCLDYLQNRQQWANLNAVAKVTAPRETATETTVHSRYYISSLAGPAKSLLEATRIGGYPPTLGHRKQLALVFGCYLSRRSQPGPQGPWSPEPGSPAPNSPQFAEARD